MTVTGAQHELDLAQEVVALYAAITDVEASVTDSQVAEDDKQSYVDDLREQLAGRLASLGAVDLLAEGEQWAN